MEGHSNGRTVDGRTGRANPVYSFNAMIQSNFNGSNIFETMEISSRYG